MKLKQSVVGAVTLGLLGGCGQQPFPFYPEGIFSTSGAYGTISSPYDPHFIIASETSGCLISEPLYAGQNTLIGQVIITTNGDNILVTYQTQDGWLLQHTHVNLSESLETVPQSGGGAPINGQFTAQTDHGSAVSNYTYSFYRADYENVESLYILTHAEAIGPDGSTETAYGGSQTWPFGSRWAYYSIFSPCLASEPEPTTEPSAEASVEPSSEPTAEPTPEAEASPDTDDDSDEDNNDDHDDGHDNNQDTHDHSEDDDENDDHDHDSGGEDEEEVDDISEYEEDVHEANCPFPQQTRHYHAHPHQVKRVKRLHPMMFMRPVRPLLPPPPKVFVSRIEFSYSDYAPQASYWEAGPVEAHGVEVPSGHVGMYAGEWMGHEEMAPRSEYGSAVAYPTYPEHVPGIWEKAKRKKRDW